MIYFYKGEYINSFSPQYLYKQIIKVLLIEIYIQNKCKKFFTDANIEKYDIFIKMNLNIYLNIYRFFYFTIFI